NVFQHFYPYFDVVEVDWENQLAPFLAAAARDPDEAAFLKTLRRMVALLEDGHGSVTHSSDAANGLLPLCWAMAEGKLVVTRVEGKEGALKVGDVIERIDGKAIETAIDARAETISAATDEYRHYRTLEALRMGVPGDSLNVTVAGREHHLRFERRAAPLTEQRPSRIEEVEKGVWYVDLDRIDDDDFKKVIDQLAAASGVVFDLRGYPRSLSTIVLSHLIEESITCPQWHIPVVRYPDRKKMTFQFSQWPVAPRAPRIQGKVAFIIDGRAISYAETYLGMVEHHRLGALVGERTAGTNGNINTFSLPGGYRVVFTGMKVLKHDGSRHHGIGIEPTVAVKRTVGGIAEGVDELLAGAMAEVGAGSRDEGEE
ncbi:MAG: S41 family peptidase, partial [Verrucomicrobiota bacterium]